MSTVSARSVAVVGAGIAGLAAARALARAGHRVVVIDKGRRVGGRTCMRRHDELSFDHGAQYFTAREPRFVAGLQHWRKLGIVELWRPLLASIEDGQLAFKEQTTERWVGVPAMNAMAQQLSTGLDVRNGLAVNGVEGGAGAWRLDAAEQVFEAEAVLLALPPQQAAALLPAGHVLTPLLARYSLSPCWAVMLGFSTPVPTRFDAAFVNDGPLSWVCRNASKPGRGHAETWILHAGAEWSSAHLEDAAETVCIQLLEAFQRLPGVPSARPNQVYAHRWRYALPTAQSAPAVPAPSSAPGIACAGDWLSGGRIEGAYLSGLDAAASLFADPASGDTTP